MKSHKAIKDYYSVYKDYVNKERGTASLLDGLKPVQRRILYSVYQIAKNKFVKSATVVGHVMGQYHPHAESYGALVNLVRAGFIDKKGNFGISHGLTDEPPAAMRYTEVKMNPLMLELAYKFMNEVEYVEAEIPGFKEPKSLPVMFPMALLGLVNHNKNEMGIGVGLRSVYPTISLKELVNVALHIIENKKIDFTTVYYDKINVKAPLNESKFKIKYKSKYKIDGKKIVITSLAPNITAKLESRFKDAYIRDESTSDTKIIIELRRGIELSKKEIDDLLSSDIKYEILVYDTDNKIVKPVTIYEWIRFVLRNYILYRKTNFLKLQTSIEEQIKQLDLITKYMPKIVAYINGKNVKLPEELLFIKEKSIRWLRNVNLKQTKTALKKDLKKVKSDLKNLRSIVYNDYEGVGKNV